MRRKGTLPKREEPEIFFRLGCGRTSYRLSHKCGELSFKGFLLFLNRSFSLRFFCNRKPRHYGVVFDYNKYPPVKRGIFIAETGKRKSRSTAGEERRRKSQCCGFFGFPGSRVLFVRRDRFLTNCKKTLFFFGKMCYNRKA